jgi:hypothetical protein
MMASSAETCSPFYFIRIYIYIYRGVVLTTHPHLSAEVKKGLGYTSTPPLGLHGLLREHHHIYIYMYVYPDFDKIYFHLKTKGNLNRARWILSIP